MIIPINGRTNSFTKGMLNWRKPIKGTTGPAFVPGQKPGQQTPSKSGAVARQPPATAMPPPASPVATTPAQQRLGDTRTASAGKAGKKPALKRQSSSVSLAASSSSGSPQSGKAKKKKKESPLALAERSEAQPLISTPIKLEDVLQDPHSVARFKLAQHNFRIAVLKAEVAMLEAQTISLENEVKRTALPTSGPKSKSNQ